MAELNNQSLAAVYEQQLQASRQAIQQQQQAEAERQRQAQEAAAAAAAEQERTRDRTLGEVAGDVGLALGQTSVGLGGALYGLANVASLGTLERATGFSENLQRTQDILESAKSAPLQARKQEASRAFQEEGLAAGAGEYLTNPSLLADLAIQSSGYLLPGAAAARFAGGTAAAGAAARGLSAAAQQQVAQQAATRASLVAQGALTGGYLNPEAITAAREAGLSEGEQQLAGLGAAAAGAVLGPAISRLTGAAGMEARAAQAFGGTALPAQAGGAAARVGAFTTTQAVEEATQEATEQAIINVAGQRPIGEGVGESAVIGGILGGALGGALGLTQIRQPSATRQELADLQAQVETELAGDTGVPAVRPSLIRQVGLQDALNRLELSRQLPQVEELSPIQAAAQTAPVEEINVGAAPAPGLTGLNAVVAQQRAIQAQQPPRPLVQEISMDQYAPAPEQEVAALPEVSQVLGRSVQDIIRETAPIERVAAQFGPTAAGFETARRAAAQTSAAAAVPQAAPLDVTSPRAMGVYKADVRNELARVTGTKQASIRGPQFDALVQRLADSGVRPGTPEFNTVVGVEANRQLAQVERAGKQSNLLGALVNNYPVTQEQQLDAAFERGGVPTTEEELFGPAPVVAAQQAPAFVDTPAARVESVEREQQWVSPQGEVYTVAAIFNGRPQLQGPRGNRVTKTKAAMEREGWGLRQPVAQAVQQRAPKPQRDLTAKEQIADLGGINISYRQDITGDTQASTREAAPGRGRIFTENGTSPDDMALQLAERNFVPAEELARDGGVQWLYNAVNRSLAGESIYAVGSEAQTRQFEQEMADRQAQQDRPADASKPSEVTAAPAKYNMQQWADYLRYPGAAQLNAITDLKEREGNPQPVLSAMLMAIDLSGDMTEFAQVSNAAQAHPEFFMMSQEDRGQVSTHMATAINRLTGATFELGMPKKVVMTDLQRALALSEDDYIATVNPTGERDTEEEGVVLSLGDLDTPTDTTAVTAFDAPGGVVSVLRGTDGTMYAVQNGQTLGSIGAFEDGTGIQLVREAQGKGIGRQLTMAYLRENPFAPAGSFTAAGEANRRSAFRALKAEQAKFSQGAIDTGMNQRLFDKGVDTAARNLGRPVFGFNTVADLEQQVGFPLPESVKGVYLDGNIYVVRENIASGKDLSLTIAHELGHSGLASLLGNSLKAATNRMWANADMRKRIRGKMAELNMAQGTEDERRASRTLAAEEVLADMLAANERLNKDIWSKLRAGVREFFARAFGIRNYVVTNKEVDDLLTDVSRVLKGAPAAQVREELQNADMWINDAEQAAEADPKFSKVKADMDELIAAAEREPASQVLPIHDIARAAGQASVDAAKSVADKLKSNTPGDLYIKNAMHLNQLSDWYDKLFKGRIGKLAALKRGKEAAFNQLNSRPQKLSYEDQDLGEQSVNDVAKDWSKFGRQNPHKFAGLNTMMQYSTLYKVFPDRAWDKQVDIDYATAGYSEEDRKATHAQMQRLYQSIGEEGRALYKKSQSIYGDRWKARFDALLVELDRIGKVHREEVTQPDGTTVVIEKYKADVRRAMQRISEGPYSPLQRNGNHLVVARDAAGDVVHFSAYDTRADAEITRKYVAERLRTEGNESGVVTITAPKDFDMRVQGVSRGTMEQLTKNVRSDLEAALPADMDPVARAQIISSMSAGLTEAYLQSLPPNAFMKHAQARKNVEGFDTDAFRAFADYTLRSARDIANIKFDGEIGSALNDVQKYVDDVAAGRIREQGQEGVIELDTTKLQSVADAVKAQHAASLQVVENKAVNALSQGAFMWFMTSPSQMFLNATQTYMVAFPRLAGIYGAGRAIRELNKSAGQYFKSRFDLLGDKSVISEAAKTDAGEAQVADVLQALYEDGTLDFTQAHDLAELSGGRNTELTPYMSKAMEVMSYAMHKSEVFNRQVTASAAVRLELDKLRRDNSALPRKGTPEYAALQAKLADTARRAIDTTHFDYSQSNKPALMQGPIGKLAFQFQQYRFHMLSMIGKDLRDAELGKLAALKPPTNPEEAKVARETLAWLLGMQLAFVGTAGTILAPFAFALADAFKDDDDLTTSRQDWINAVGKYAAHGVLAGVIDTQRIAADTLIPYLGGKAYEPIGASASETLQYHISQNLGPWAGLLGDAFDGGAAVMNGDIYKATQELLPKPFRDVTKALYEGANGARDARQIMYYEPSVLSGVTGFIGLRSAERRDVEAGRSAVYRANTTAFQTKDRYLTRMAVAYSQGDNELIAETQQDIQAWNAKYPDFAIKAQDIARAITKRVRTEQIAAQTGVVSSRLPGPTIDAVLGR